MIRIAAVRFAIVLLAVVAGCSTFHLAPSAPVELRLIGINDFHGNLEGTGLNLFLADPQAPAGTPALRVNVGGAASLAGMVRMLREGTPNSLMIAGGDLVGAAPLVSTLFRHESTIEILNDIGLDLSAVGNHEFDGGTKELRRLMDGGCAPNVPGSAVTSCPAGPYQGARFPYIAANVTTSEGRSFVAPYVIKQVEGIPIAFIGGVLKATPQMVTPSGIAGLRFGDEADGVNRAADELRAKGVKAMVAVFHEGFELGTSAKRGDWNDVTCPEAHGPLLGIAKRLRPEIKVVFSGHTHQGYRCEIDGRLIIQSTSYGRGISVVDVQIDRATQALVPRRSWNLAVMNETTDPAHRAKLAAAAPEPFARVLRDAKPDAAIAEKVARYNALAAPQAQRSIGRITGPFTRTGRSDSSLGRLIADAQLAATKAEGAQIAFMNPGGIRADIECAAPPCAVTFGQAFTAQPFGNGLVIMSLTGAQIRKALESQQRGAGGNPRFLQPSEGFTYTWQSDAPPGERVRDMKLNGEHIVPEKTYRVTVNSFLAEAGDGFDSLLEGTGHKGGGPDIDALVAFLSAGERSPSAIPRVTRLP
jgi:5'-nucleotidase